MDRKRVFLETEDAGLAVQLVRLLDGNGVTAFSGTLTARRGSRARQGYRVW